MFELVINGEALPVLYNSQMIARLEGEAIERGRRIFGPPGPTVWEVKRVKEVKVTTLRVVP